MRSAFVLAVSIDALRYEIGDLNFAASRSGVSPDESVRLDLAMANLKKASEHLKAYRFIKKVEDLPAPEESPKPKKK